MFVYNKITKKNIIKFLSFNLTKKMEKFINLLSKDNKKSIIIYIFVNIILVFFETLSIALIPLVIDFVISEKPFAASVSEFVRSDI